MPQIKERWFSWHVNLLHIVITFKKSTLYCNSNGLWIDVKNINISRHHLERKNVDRQDRNAHTSMILEFLQDYSAKKLEILPLIHTIRTFKKMCPIWGGEDLGLRTYDVQSWMVKLWLLVAVKIAIYASISKIPKSNNFALANPYNSGYQENNRFEMVTNWRWRYGWWMP